jgi:hypothetical protein
MKARDQAVKAFVSYYKNNTGDFPTEVRDRSGGTQYRPNDLTDCSEHDQKQSQPPQHFISTLKSCRSWIATDRNPNWLSSSANPIRHAIAE